MTLRAVFGNFCLYTSNLNFLYIFVNIPQCISRFIYHCIEYWDLVHKERLRPSKNPDGTITFSSAQIRRVFSTSRLPGETMDHIECHFKTASEGKTPSYYIVIGKGHLFKVNVLNVDGSIVSPQQLLAIHRQIRDTIEDREVELPVPILTCANRTAWAIVSRIMTLPRVLKKIL